MPKIRLPFPGRLNQCRKGKEDKEILETFRNIEINIPLLDAIRQIPRSIVHPEGVLEDVLVKVNELIFPADFYLIKMEEDNTAGSSDLLLGRPFLSTASTKINVRSSTLTMEFDREIVKFNVYDAISHPNKILSVNHVDMIDSLVDETFESTYEDQSEYRTDDYEFVNTLLSPSETKLLPFVVQAPDLEMKPLPEHLKYAFLGKGFFQIPIALEDQEKTTFTCPFGTFVYRRIPFGLCNVPATFQRCMMSIFSEYVEKLIEVFMDDFTVYGNYFIECLENLTIILNKCIEFNLVLNNEKCYFMVDKGLILGHIVSSKGIEVDKAKIGIINSLPYPSTKDKKFEFSPKCKEAFDTLKQKLVTAPIVQDEFPDEIFFSTKAHYPWYADIVNLLTTGSLPTELARSVKDKLRRKARFGTPRALISDRGTHFCNKVMEALLSKYGVIIVYRRPTIPKRMG
ncbi:uncharacterized protein LOC128285449 [Gossypium arboreum]|uniref:uncharacterized protein LOC128285449 n=1 Tax=Gossypium arboreum TaxID=29729 RepID=UPI0022F16744|nr:uncharacterized protein LOC128285449 [Gossypium arboreum]